ncbi:MAG: DegT/DnrJ/EryC1/StrS family aminotransferase [Candidatus Omnitrophota bacterium]|nr:DegT/DnrJ/EryC1/StrS family aminotransferase [Candidatus Omnitrophota bacterium]
MAESATRITKVPLVDLKRQYESIQSEIQNALYEVIANQQFILGPKVAECEAEVAAYSGCSYGCGVSSGTDALLLPLMAEGIGAGDEVITTPFTFLATAECVARLGARPVFVDIDPATYNLDPSLVADKLTAKTKAIVPVHLYGQMADMDPLMQIAKQKNLIMIEDAAQAIGAEDKGRRAGSIGHYGSFSFFPTKNLGGFGDGGMIVTQDAARSQKVHSLRTHGMSTKYRHTVLGGNFRFDAIQAAVILVKLKFLDEWTRKRGDNAKLYGRLLNEAGLVEAGKLSLPIVSQVRHVFHQYCIRTARRDELKNYLQEKGIGCGVYYPVPLHLQECFKQLGYKRGDFPGSEKAAAEVLALPIYPELTEDEIRFVVSTIKEFY